MIAVQKAIIDTLLSDGELQSGLGNQPLEPSSVMEAQGFSISAQKYPIITVGIVSETPRRMNHASTLNGKRVSDVYLEVHVFSKKKTSEELGTLDTRVRELLDGANLSTPSLTAYLCELESLVLKEKETETGIWHQISRYHVIARPH